MWYFYAIIKTLFKTLFTKEWHPLSVRTAGQRAVRSAVTGTLWVCSSSLRKQTRQQKDNSNSDKHWLEPKYVEEHLWKRRSKSVNTEELQFLPIYHILVVYVIPSTHLYIRRALMLIKLGALQCGRCWFFFSPATGEDVHGFFSLLYSSNTHSSHSWTLNDWKKHWLVWWVSISSATSARQGQAQY